MAELGTARFWALGLKPYISHTMHVSIAVNTTSY